MKLTIAFKLVEDLMNPKKKVIVQVAPAVRVAIGELFGVTPGIDNYCLISPEYLVLMIFKILSCTFVISSSFKVPFLFIHTNALK